WPILARTHGDNVALEDIHGTPPSRLTYRQMAASVEALAAGFWTLGVRSGDRVALFAEGSGRWLQADQALMRAGAISAVRGSSCPLDELAYIWKHSRAAYLVVQDAPALLSLAPMLVKGGGHDGLGSAPAAAVVLWGPSPGEEELRRAGWPTGSPVRAFEEVERAGSEALLNSGSADDSDSAYAPPPPLRLSSPATIVYTSGTTSLPRGVLLTQSNLLSQLRQIQTRIPLPGSHTFLSLLPPWHIYQRTVQYYLSLRHCRLVFSAVPKLREDLQTVKPDILVAVPL
ncbi:AMP-binding enzyme, partial [Helicosporidium sp. ATCC 50920]